MLDVNNISIISPSVYLQANTGSENTNNQVAPLYLFADQHTPSCTSRYPNERNRKITRPPPPTLTPNLEFGLLALRLWSFFYAHNALSSCQYSASPTPSPQNGE